MNLESVFLMAITAAVAFGFGGLVGVWAGLSIANEPSEIRGRYQSKADRPLDPLKPPPAPDPASICQTPDLLSIADPAIQAGPQSICYPRRP